MELAKELALIVAILRENEVLSGTLFNTFDQLFTIAEKFVETYGLDDSQWGIEVGRDFEEAVVEFGNNFTF